MRERTHQPPRPDAPDARAPARRNLGPAAVLALQRRIGNAAVRRVLARDPQTKPDPLAKYRPVESDKPLNLPKQWQNSYVLATAYPGREAMFRKFVAIYRELELAPDKDTKPARDKIKAEADALTGPALQKEVDRLLGSTAVPDWLKDQVRDYAGMRYYMDATTREGRHGAHQTYYSAVRLMYVLKRAEGDWTKAREDERKSAQDALDTWTKADHKTRGAKPPPVPDLKAKSNTEKAWLQMSEDNAMGRLEQMHNGVGGYMPDWAWHEIVRLTPLRGKHAKAGWEDLTKEKPDPSDTFWIKVMKDWTGNEDIGEFEGGGVGWRHESLDKQRQVADAVVCNELSETTQIKRGVRLPGGIRKNAEYFAKAAVDGAQPGASAEIAGSYFKRVESAADLKPGASLFWINTVWQAPKPGDSFDNSNMVFPIDGIDWPIPFPPEYVKAWADWDKRRKAKEAWDRKPKGEDPGDAGEEPKFDQQALPDDGDVIDDWTYTNKPGQAITREHDVDDKHHEKQWMLWQHQATVLQAMPDGRVFVFETTSLNWNDPTAGVTGFTEHGLTKKDLLSGFVYVGYIPGRVDAAAARP